MAVFGHSGSHAPQLMHSAVIIVAIADFPSSDNLLFRIAFEERFQCVPRPGAVLRVQHRGQLSAFSYQPQKILHSLGSAEPDLKLKAES
jgi:hypothetical protein